MPDRAEIGGKYTADSIVVLDSVEAVRRRPAMYVGSLDDPSGVIQLVIGAVSWALIRSDGHRPLRVELRLCADGGYDVRDDAPPPSDDPRSGSRGRSALELVLTAPALGRSWHRERPWSQAGADLAVLCALCAWLRVETRVSDRRCVWEFARGRPAGAPRAEAAAPARATRLAFRLDPDLFAPHAAPDFATLAGHARVLAAGHPWLKLTLHEERSGRSLSVAYPEGAADLLRETAGLSDVCLQPVLRVEHIAPAIQSGAVRADVALACFTRASGSAPAVEFVRVDSALAWPDARAIARQARRGFRRGLGAARIAGRRIASAVLVQGFDTGGFLRAAALEAEVCAAAARWDRAADGEGSRDCGARLASRGRTGRLPVSVFAEGPGSCGLRARPRRGCRCRCVQRA
jgi:hypothetical protein